MKNYVNFETASRLKATGFPQPGFEFGQVWNDGEGCWLLCIEKNFFVQKGTIEVRYTSDQLNGWLTFAPTAADIMKALGCEYVFWYDEYKRLSMFFVCKTGASYRDAGKPTGHINPAEAAALAWLEIHEKKQEP